MLTSEKGPIHLITNQPTAGTEDHPYTLIVALACDPQRKWKYTSQRTIGEVGDVTCRACKKRWEYIDIALDSMSNTVHLLHSKIVLV